MTVKVLLYTGEMASTRVSSAPENERQGRTLRELLPQSATRNVARVDEIELGYSRIEPRGECRGTAVLVAGYTSSYDTFNVILEPLAENGFRVIGLSQRGQPHSTGPESVDGYSLEILGRDVIKFLDAVGLDEPVHLLGHSFGGVVATEAVIRSPERFASLTLWNSGPKDFGEGSVAYEALLRGGAVELWITDRQRVGMDTTSHLTGSLNVIEQYYFDRLTSTRVEQLIAGAAILRDQVDRTDELAATGVRTLVSHGAEDDAWPVDWQRDMATRLGADYVVLANAGHSSHGDRPNMAADVLAAFWSDCAT